MRSLRLVALLCITAVVVARPVPVTHPRAARYTGADFGDTTFVLACKRAIIARMAAVEAHFGIQFELGWVPSVRVGLPAYVHPARRSLTAAVYEPETRSIAVSEVFARLRDLDRARVEPDSVSSQARELVDAFTHELGHAYADQVSRELGLGQWPPTDGVPPLDIIGYSIQTEGIAHVFGQGIPKRIPTESLAWVDDLFKIPPEYCQPVLDQIIDDGGYTIAGSLAFRYGVAATTRYLVTHSLKLERSSFARPIQDWRAAAVQHLDAGR